MNPQALSEIDIIEAQPRLGTISSLQEVFKYIDQDAKECSELTGQRHLQVYGMFCAGC
jgi:hypothetical protein